MHVPFVPGGVGPGGTDAERLEWRDSECPTPMAWVGSSDGRHVAPDRLAGRRQAIFGRCHKPEAFLIEPSRTACA